MLAGVTTNGFEYEIPDEALDNMELLDALREFDKGNRLIVSDVCAMLLGDEQKKRLYEHLRTPKGNVPITEIEKTLTEIMKGNKAGKN